MSLLISVSSAFGNDFETANAMYEKGDFAAALPLYQKLAMDHPKEAAYHFNLGNAYVKTSAIGRAVASYLRAFELAPRDGDIRYNLTFTLARAGDELIPPGIPYPIFLLAYALSREELSGLFWLSFWSFCLLSAAILALPSPIYGRGVGGESAVSSLASIAFCFVLFLGAWQWMRNSMEPAQTAVTIRSDAEIRNGPGTNFSVAFTFPEGRRLEVLMKKGDWLEVASPKENAKGWIESTAVEKI